MQPNLSREGKPLSFAFWTMLLGTGVASGLVGGLLMRLLSWIEQASFGYGGGDFLVGVRAASGERKVLVLVAAGVVAGAAGWLASQFKGDTDLSGAVWERSGRMPLWKSSIRGFYSIVVVGMGAAVGRENALKEAGGVLANLGANWRGLNDRERRLLVACGGGAGMAAAYNVPLGGALFTLEILLGSFALGNVVPAFAASMLAVWTSWLLLPDKATYTISAAKFSTPLVVWALVAGGASGVLGAGFIRLMAWAKGWKPKGWMVVGLPVVSLAALGLVAVKLPEMLGNGKEVIQLTFLNGTTVGVLLLLVVLRPLATAVIFRSGVPGGLFTPTMALGAVAGLLLGKVWEAAMPHGAAGLMPTCALIGAAAVLAAATQGPVSSLVFVLELTRTADATMVPLLVGVVVSALAVRSLEKRSIYSIEGTGAKPVVQGA